jgi:hypothetical protein
MKKIYIGLMGVILVCQTIVIMVLAYDRNDPPKVERNDAFLVDFDQVDFLRMQEVIARYEEGLGDNILMIPPIVDGGYSIHEYGSNGREIWWRVDNTRDGMASEHSQTVYTCHSISMVEGEHFHFVELSDCDNYEDDEKLRMVGFLKEHLE